MKNFFKMMFASTLGAFIAITLMAIISFILFVGVVASSSAPRTYKPVEKAVLKIDLSGSVNDRVEENPFDVFFGEVTKESKLSEILDAIKKAKENDFIKGIYLHGGVIQSGTSSLDAIRRELIEFKKSGKFVIAYADNYLQGSYFLASAADKVILNPQGMLELRGLAATPMFYKGLLDKIGIKIEVFKVGTFKSAVEPFILDKMSDANRKQVESYINSIWKNVSIEIANSRNLSVDKVNELANAGIIFSDPVKIVASGLVDTLMYSTDVSDYIKVKIGTDLKEKLPTVSVAELTTLPFKDKKLFNDEIAILYAEGEITEAPTGAFSSEIVITDEVYVKELRKLKNDESVKAVVFRINSPGGSGYMSEQIWRQVEELKKEKPVIVSMGNVAASGGYYIACGADYIVAEPTTITGSIGVFGMYPNLEGLYGKIGVSSDVVKTNTYADLGDPSRQMKPEEKALIQGYVERFYDVFLTRCADGRHKSKQEIDLIAQGRVWTGEQALSIGLVDELGGLDKAVSIAAQKAQLENYTTVSYPEERSFLSRLMDDSFNNMKMKLTKNMIGEDEFQYYLLLKNIKSQDVIQARIPFDLEIK